MNCEDLVVKVASPLDFFENWACPFNIWLGEECPNGHRVALFIAACGLVVNTRYWDNHPREIPYVGYDHHSETYFFIFKIDNNGTTFLVMDKKCKITHVGDEEINYEEELKK